MVPKTGGRVAEPPQRAIRLSDFGSTESDEMARFHALSAGNTERTGSGGGGAGGGGRLVVPRHASPSASVRAKQRRMLPNSTRPCRVDVVPVTGRLRPCPTPASTGILAPSPMSKVKV